MSEEKSAEMKEEMPEVAPFDPTKKKKKKKVVIQDSADEVDKLAEKTENLTVAESGELSFVGMKKKKKKPVETDENGDFGEDLSGDQIGEDEEGESIILGGARYPWEGTDRDYKYEEVGCLIVFVNAIVGLFFAYVLFLGGADSDYKNGGFL